jgi:regulator of protease activity HflC (stomatin/prohibitin superfamily)
MITENVSYRPISGFIMIFVQLALALVSFILINSPLVALAAVTAAILFFLFGGYIIVDPNESKVLTLFGEYKGTVKSFGFYWVNPFMKKKSVSLRARNLNGAQLKVNDKLGNPIEIAAVIVWQVKETAKASFEVDDYNKFVFIQSEAAVRHLANTYPYDNIQNEFVEGHPEEITLRGGGEIVNQMLEKELNERLDRAGIHVIEARISHLAYAPEIAGAMLQRQQATAVVAARRQIVEGAVGMVEMALERISQKSIVTLDEDKKATMVSNLLVVLCGEKNVSPVVNTGTLHQ